MILGISVAVLWVIADQLAKAWASSALIGQNTIPVLGQWLRFTYVQNEGVAFGLFAGQKWIFIVFSVLAVAFLLLMLKRYQKVHPVFPVALGFIIGGAVGNLIDRIRFGWVVDFIQVDFLEAIHFPVFNVADIGVTVGIFVLAALLLLLPEHVWRPES